MTTIGTQSSPFFFGWVVIKGGDVVVRGGGVMYVGSVVRGAWGCVTGGDVM